MVRSVRKRWDRVNRSRNGHKNAAQFERAMYIFCMNKGWMWNIRSHYEIALFDLLWIVLSGDAPTASFSCPQSTKLDTFKFESFSPPPITAETCQWWRFCCDHPQWFMRHIFTCSAQIPPALDCERKQVEILSQDSSRIQAWQSAHFVVCIYVRNEKSN